MSVQNEFGFRERGELVSAVFACHRCSMRTGPMLVKHSEAARGLPCPPCNGLPTPPEYKPAPPSAAHHNRKDRGNA
ncbi:hypothetical protein [Burkholderia gladioli]|uniref:hypothetical protein n=1 Tax=Burkholderia gladioli TaxID=28095 RepID=UPI0016402374|nr:hypothetical protein [Burkholderia gladioli]